MERRQEEVLLDARPLFRAVAGTARTDQADEAGAGVGVGDLAAIFRFALRGARMAAALVVRSDLAFFGDGGPRSLTGAGASVLATGLCGGWRLGRRRDALLGLCFDGLGTIARPCLFVASPFVDLVEIGLEVGHALLVLHHFGRWLKGLGELVEVGRGLLTRV